MATFLEEKSASSDDSIDHSLVENLADRLDTLLLNSSKTKVPISFEYYPPKTDAGLEPVSYTHLTLPTIYSV